MKYLLAAFVVISCNSKKVSINRHAELKNRCDLNPVCYLNSAEEDFDSGALQVFIPGLVTEKSFADYFSVCLFNRNVRVISSGDVFDTFIVVYNKKMEEKIRTKFGNQFWDECVEEADSLSKMAREN